MFCFVLIYTSIFCELNHKLMCKGVFIERGSVMLYIQLKVNQLFPGS